VTCKPGTEEAFRQATLENARQSALEPGIARFDVLQDTADPTKFCLVEVYHDTGAATSPDTNEAAKAHKETEHYLKWRDAVADMMAEPRQAIKFVNHFPTTLPGWSYPEGASLE
jgi:(4S)-4-hydroxy-5-phosphonooxypentane-2,3-dione isomerase